MAVRRGWLGLMKPSIQDYGDILKALQAIDAFIDNLREQVLNVRRGPLTSIPSLVEGQKLSKAFDTLKAEIRRAKDSAQHWQSCYEGTALGNCRADGEKMLDLYRKDFEEATGGSKPQRGGRGLARGAPLTEFFDDLLKLLYADVKRIQEYYNLETLIRKQREDAGETLEPFEHLDVREPVFKEFAFGRMKVVILDPKTNGNRIREYVKRVDAAHQLIERRGFKAVWYGVMFLVSGDYKELSKSEQEAYAKAGYKDLQAVAGLFHSGRDVIELTSPADSSLVHTICHEMGHRYWFKVLSQENRARFTEFLEQGVLPVSSYGRNNEIEAFAEVFAWYCVGKDLSRDQLESFKAVLASSGPMSPHRDPIADRLVERFRESGVVVPLKTSGPTIAISGRKYALSDYWSVMEGLEESSSGARLILPEGPTNKFRYLWAFDTEKRVLAMWRVSDGDEKAFGRENQHSRDLVILEKKRQLNRVTTDEFRAIERFMRGRQDDALAAMKKYLEENADEWDRESRRLVEEFFSKNIEPKILAKFREIDQGVVPFGFKPNESHRPPLEAAKMHVAMAIFGKEFTLKDVENFIKIKGIDPENPPGDIQALDWARHDVMDAFYEAYFPHVASE
jgi:hypothetical protein